MKIFEIVLERGLLELHQLQQCWELATRDLRFSQHNDIAKVILAKNLLPQDEMDKIINIVDEVVIDVETPDVEKPEVEQTDDFMDRMKKISQMMRKVKFKESTQQIRGVTNFKVGSESELLRANKIKVPKIDDEQEIKTSDLRDIKSRAQRVVTEFSKEEEVLDLDNPSVLPVTRSIFFVFLAATIISVVVVAIVYKNYLFN